jgi:hypothetical protein
MLGGRRTMTTTLLNWRPQSTSTDLPDTTMNRADTFTLTHADTFTLTHVFPEIQSSAQRYYDDEKKAFSLMLPLLHARYSGEHVIIEHGVIADHDKSRRTLITRFFNQPRHDPLYIGFVGPRRTVRVPTPRFRRSHK